MRVLMFVSAVFVAQRACAEAAFATAAAGAVAAGATGHDPLPWVVSGVGAVVAHLKSEPTQRRVSIANGALSVMLGGFGAYPLAALAADRVHAALGSPYLAATLLSVFWPVAFRVIRERFGSGRSPK